MSKWGGEKGGEFCGGKVWECGKKRVYLWGEMELSSPLGTLVSWGPTNTEMTMNREEQKEMLDLLEQAGWQPMPCDTLVPCFENEVLAGIPTMPGDIAWDENVMMSSELAELERVYYVRVKGDSMKDAGILAGDRVQLCMDGIFGDGDIVVASIDGEMTLKTFYRDEQGRSWLVPFNENYSPILLQEDMGVKIVGRVDALMRKTPRRPHAEVERIMRKAREEGAMAELRDPADIIAEVAPMVKCKRQWYAVYRALVDMELIGWEMFATFVEMVAESVPQHAHLPSLDSMRRSAVQSFCRPVSKWDANYAPVAGKRFEEYVRIAKRTEEVGRARRS